MTQQDKINFKTQVWTRNRQVEYETIHGGGIKPTNPSDNSHEPPWYDWKVVIWCKKERWVEVFVTWDRREAAIETVKHWIKKMSMDPKFGHRKFNFEDHKVKSFQLPHDCGTTDSDPNPWYDLRVNISKIGRGSWAYCFTAAAHEVATEHIENEIRSPRNLSRWPIKKDNNRKTPHVKYIYITDQDICYGAVIFNKGVWYACTVDHQTNSFNLLLPSKEEASALKLLEDRFENHGYNKIIIEDEPVALARTPAARLKITRPIKQGDQSDE